jgi:hypothetical protein
LLAFWWVTSSGRLFPRDVDVGREPDGIAMDFEEVGASEKKVSYWLDSIPEMLVLR